MQRVHIHLPITRENGDLLSYVDATLWHEDGTLLTTPVYDGPNDSALQITWPVTFAPSIVDLWIDEVGRHELHLSGPEGYSGMLRAVDFLPAPDEQVQIDKQVQVVNIVQPKQWLRVEGGQVRWLDSGQIAAHTHDGPTANSTLLESVDADPEHTLLGSAAAAGGTGSTVVGAQSSTVGADATVVGPNSHAAAGAVILGDASGSGQPAEAVWLPYGDAGALDALVDSDSVLLRSVAVESASTRIGTAGTVGTGGTTPVWLLGDVKTQSLDARASVHFADATGTVALFGVDGTTQAVRPKKSKNVLTALLDVLQAHGLLSP